MGIYGNQYEVMAVVDVPYYLDTYTVLNEIPFIMKDTVVQSLDDAYCVYRSIYCGNKVDVAEKAAGSMLLHKDEWKQNMEVISSGVIRQKVALFLVYRYSMIPVVLLEIVIILLIMGIVIYELKKVLQKYEVKIIIK